MAGNNEVVIRFNKVSFEYGHNKPILKEVSFSVRRGSKVTIMGQNGAGKSTLFGLITGFHSPEEGEIHMPPGVSIAIARQVIPRDEMDLTVREFFQKCFTKKIYDIDPRIDKVLEVVNLVGHEKVHDRIIKSFSGGQLARMLLASALIQEPDILLLDEPTNNLDKAGIAHLTDFLVNYKKTVLVISHDAEFLNAFTHGVLYLDIHTKLIEQYSGNYNDVLKDITVRVERENMKNAQLQKTIIAKKEKANQFAYKGGQMRLVAKKMRELAEDLEEELVEVRQEDKTIRSFRIPAQDEVLGEIASITSFSVAKGSKISKRKANIVLKKNQHLLLRGPNGIGKSTLLEKIANREEDGVVVDKNVRIGYYRQDFSNISFDKTVHQILIEAMEKSDTITHEETLRSAAGSFLISRELIHTKFGTLSEGQKGLVSFARLVLEKPGLLILDEPTNHINFRHIPVIAEALNQYTGAMILVSHVPEFVSAIRIDEILDLDK